MAAVALALLRNLPLAAAWLGCLALAREWAVRRSGRPGWRVPVLLANVLWAALLTSITETTSALGCFNLPAVVVGWAGVGIGLWVAAVHAARRRGGSPRDWLSSPSGWGWPSGESRWWAAVAAGVAGMLGLVALLTPTTNYDSFTYHLPRVLHWIQNQSVAHYPTSDTRQLESAPWAAYVLAHLRLLSGTDRLLNLPQWWSMILTALAVSLLVQQLGGRARPAAGEAGDAPRDSRSGGPPAGLVAALLAITLPTGMVQSITSQNDYMVTQWLACFAVLALCLRDRPDDRWLAWAAGLAAGLGLLTKVTFIVYAAPLVLWLAWQLRTSLLRGALALRLSLALLLGVLALNAPHFVRNEALFGSPLGSRYMFGLQRNARTGWDVTLSNVLRNLSLHAATGWEPATRAINRVLATAHRATGRSLNDPDSTLVNAPFAYQTGFPITDNLTGAFHHLCLAAVALAILAARRRTRVQVSWGLLLAILASFVLFCGLLRWQAWHARFHLPYLALLMPLAAPAVAAWDRRARWGVLGGAALLAFYCLGWNKSRPILAGGDFLFQPREQQYFVQVPELYFPTVQVAEDLAAAGCREVGLRVRHDFYRYLDEMEYPLWVLLEQRGFQGRIHHVFFGNESLALRPWTPPLDAVVTSPGPQVAELGRRFPWRTVYEPFAVHWTDRSSRWAQLDWGREESRQKLPPRFDALPFGHDRLSLALHSGRPGLLRLKTGLVEDQGPPPGVAGLLVKTYAGYVQVHRLGGGPLELSLPMPEGSTAVLVQAVDRQGEPHPGTVWRDFEWDWHAVDDPLPWACLTRVGAGKTSGQADDTRLFALGPEPTTLQIRAGAPGILEVLAQVRFEPGASVAAPRTIRVGAPGGESPAHPLTPGPNVVRVPVSRGTNTVTLAWTEPHSSGQTIEVMELEWRFRP